MALTVSQEAASVYCENLILFAGPGSGKTSTSVVKGIHILNDPANRLCMVTFTSAAADEMRERMINRLQADRAQSPGTRLICGTFHSIALRHYQKHARNTPRLIAPPAKTAMVNAMLFDLMPEERKEFQLALEKYQGALDQSQVEFDDFKQHDFVVAYHKRLETSNSTDLSMVMRDCATQMVNGQLPLLPITHLLGDEMQDADEIQLEMILAHTRKGVITTLVADDDQTIYEWRSALGYAGLQKFGREANAKTIALSENFRSRQEIVHHAKLLIANNDPNRIDKNQRSTRGPGGVLGHECFAGLNQQCSAIVRYVLESRKPGESVAVLARTNFPLQTMGRALNEKAIPYVMKGPSIWDLPAVAIAISMLQALTNNSTSSFQPVLSIFPLDAKLRRELERKLGHDATSFLSGGEVPDLDHATDTDAKFLQSVAASCKLWNLKLAKGEISLLIPEVIDQVYEWYASHLALSSLSASTMRSQTKRVREAFEHVERILLALDGKLSKRLSILGRLQDKEQGSEAIRLCTMHSSKGLEFDTVFLIDSVSPDDGSLIAHEQAERCLFYVAMTRAKERFFALYSDVPTPFIAEAELPKCNLIQYAESV
ncbi:MAG: ATP-dependent helicase [Rhodoferax sp.]|nr:ATP-dependent helicase [Rhodoferax sp.]